MGMTIDPENMKMLDEAVASLGDHGAPMGAILSEVAARDQARHRAAEEVACVLVDGLAEVLGRRGDGHVPRG
jgi:hypothetical protein